MAPRGLKTILKRLQTAKLVKRGGYTCFAPVRDGVVVSTALRGVTKRLGHRLFSKGAMPIIARQPDDRPGGHWRGANGGRVRGKKVDAQITRLVNAGAAARKNIKHVYRLTKFALSALSSAGLEPVLAQFAVASETLRLATAADVVCFNKRTNKIAVVELKTGFPHGRTAAAVLKGKAQTMHEPCKKAADNTNNRHFAQLALTHYLLNTPQLRAKLSDLAIDTEIDALLLYACDSGTELYNLPIWWQKRASKIACVCA